MNERKGYVSQTKDGAWFCRITATDTTGRRRDIKRTAKSRLDARSILKQLIRGLDDEGTQIINAWGRTFADLADFYESRYAIPAQFVDGQKANPALLP